MFSCLRIQRKAKEETPFMKNGRLEELIASCNGKCNPLRTFSDRELSRATNNYHREQMILQDSDYILYKGFLEDRSISVKKYGLNGRDRLMGSAIVDIVIGSQMSVQKNVLKLIGCCLETALPILVYEFVGNETLSDHIRNSFGKCFKPLPWKCRTKIAADIASAVAYLHTALSRPVVLRDIRLSTILLGENNDAKLVDFSLSISIPDGESHIITAVCGKTGYGPPEYICSGYVTEKLDVFYLGILLLELLTGHPYFYKSGDMYYLLPDHVHHCLENQKLIEIVDPMIVKDIQQQGLLAFVTLALSCICREAEDRPTMTDVARELEQIHQSIMAPN